ncbi:hypothetical protein [Hyphomonas sp. GM-8P]|uniref:hypothetical protein n=1 Tax=Hyphomonas sp. GM-8P TaxID=1280945 RepID=UPI000DBFA3B7|nr:hypothetical protein [Hyphomonas sp. GM-8P]RAN38735.1 hypothetical protein HY26_17335 [Hyphomonas sp. GM-8P]
MLRLLLLATLTLVLSGKHAQAEMWNCVVDRKIDSERVYTDSDIQKWQPRAALIVTDAGAIIARCGFSIASGNRETCDYYDADRIEQDPVVGVIKAYYFRGQMDLQIYPNQDGTGGTFVENNGRGTISFGPCTVN